MEIIMQVWQKLFRLLTKYILKYAILAYFFFIILPLSVQRVLVSILNFRTDLCFLPKKRNLFTSSPEYYFQYEYEYFKFIKL